MEMPYDEKSANYVLSKFMENAMNTKYLKIYQKAVEIKFGYEFDIKLDLSNRMCFSCKVCHKEMNNVKSLVEHSKSGTHLKLKDSIFNKTHERILPLKKHRFSSRSQIPLIWKIERSLVKIIGLQYIEAYDDERGRYYYKCNLCGSHGNADMLYNHVIGNSHTDKYIKSRVRLEKVVYGPDERAELREKIAKRESYSVADIAVIRGKYLYPRMWEIHCRAKPKNKRKEFDFNPQENRQEASSISKEYMTYQYFETILLKFNAFVQVHLNNASDLHCGKDLRFAMAVHFYIMHLLFYQFRYLKHKCQSSGPLDFFNEQDMHIKKAMGALRLKLNDLYTAKYSKECGDLPDTFYKK